MAFKKGDTSPMKGRKHSILSKLKMSESRKGVIPWNKGRTGLQLSWNKGKKTSPKVIEKMRIAHLGIPNQMKGEKFPKAMGKKISKALTGRKLTKKHIRNCLKRNPKSSLEIKFEQIIQKHNLPYKFVGNGEVLIGRKCPDFVNINGEKIAIEVFYRKHKEQFRGGLGDWMQERWKLFNSYGFELIFFDETQVNESEILRRLG